MISVLVINDTRVDRHHGCYSVMAAIGQLLERNGLGQICYWPAHSDWRGDAGFDRALGAARLVIINGEGTIHHDRPAGRLLLEAGVRARAAKVPVALINTGWEANGPDLVALLDNFDVIAARDSWSAALMRAGGAKVRVVPDLSLWHALQYPRSYATDAKQGVGFTDNVDRIKSLALEELRSAYGGERLAICHGDTGIVGWMRYMREGVALSQDTLHPQRLAALLRLRNAFWWSGSVEANSFLARISGFELLVTGRFHACTLALATGTPVIAQSSNTNKIAALFNDAGLESWRSELALDILGVNWARIRGWSECERESLRTYLQGATTAAEDLFKDLATLAAG